MEFEPALFLQWVAVTVMAAGVAYIIYFVATRVQPRSGLVELRRKERLMPTPTAPFHFITPKLENAESLVVKAQQALSAGHHGEVIEYCVQSISDILRQLLAYYSTDAGSMSISDMAYVLEVRGVRLPITERAYRINMDRLMAMTGRPVSRDEALVAVSSTLWILESTRETPV